MITLLYGLFGGMILLGFILFMVGQNNQTSPSIDDDPIEEFRRKYGKRRG